MIFELDKNDKLLLNEIRSYIEEAKTTVAVTAIQQRLFSIGILAIGLIKRYLKTNVLNMANKSLLGFQVN